MSGLTAIYARKDTTSGGGVPVAEKAARDRELRLQKRWVALKQMHRIIRLPQNRRPGLEDMTHLAETFEKVLAHNDDPLVKQKIHYYFFSNFKYLTVTDIFYFFIF